MRSFALFIFVVAIAACSKHQPSEFNIEGLDQQAVIDRVGEPKREFELVGKSLKNSIGPKPRLTAQMADNETVEVWTYTVTESREASVFFDNSGVVAEVIIYRTNVMY